MNQKWKIMHLASDFANWAPMTDTITTPPAGPKWSAVPQPRCEKMWVAGVHVPGW